MTSKSAAVEVATAAPARHRKYGWHTTALEVLKDVDLAGKTCLITGASGGIGLQTARSLALHGAHVVMMNRDAEKSAAARERIYAEARDERSSHSPNIDILLCNLSSLASARSAATEFLARGWPLHVLVLNAGVLGPTEKTTTDGHESAFGVNYLGHFYLTQLLLPKLREAAPGRLVVVSSIFHRITGINKDWPLERKMAKLVPPPTSSESSLRLYAYTSMCKLLFAFRLHEQEHAGSGIHTYALHPGATPTGIWRHYGLLGKISSLLTKPFIKSAEQGAATSVFCATSHDAAHQSGMYYTDCWEDEGGLSELARDRALQDALWDKSLELVRNFEEGHK